jgi:hypothetical protein
MRRMEWQLQSGKRCRENYDKRRVLAGDPG